MWYRVKLFLFFLIFCGWVTPVWAGETEDSRLIHAEEVFMHYCAHCHGTQGDGDGFNAEFLGKEPTQLSDSEFISKKSNDQIFRIINNGGVGVRKSHLMPVFGKTLSEDEIWSLVAYIRKLAEDDSHPVPEKGAWNSKRPEWPPVTGAEIISFSNWFKSRGKEKESLETGEYLFHKKKSCLACHQINEEEGGRVGPSLVRAGFYYKPEWVFAWIKNPHVFKPETKMPNLPLENEEAQTIAAFLNDQVEEDAAFVEELKPFLEQKGDPQKGKQLFFDQEEKANCGKCHRINGEGGKVGPDLSLVGSSRRPEFILESILNPKAVITAGFKSVLILTKEGKLITGIKKNEDDSSLDIVDKKGKNLHIPKDQIKKFKVQKISIMPGNFKDLLSVEEIADLLVFLKTLTHPAFAGTE